MSLGLYQAGCQQHGYYMPGCMYCALGAQQNMTAQHMYSHYLSSVSVMPAIGSDVCNLSENSKHIINKKLLLLL